MRAVLKRFEGYTLPLMGLGLVIALALCIYLLVIQKKVAYVRMGHVIENYEGTKEAALALQEKVRAYQVDVERIDSMLNGMAQNYNALSPALRKSTEAQVKEDATKLAGQKETISGKVQELDRKMTDEMMIQIDEYVKQFAEKNGYDIILSVNESGTLVYASEGDDITYDLLKYLNSVYKGK